jgi:hydroxyacyl-ACP dehydratase HTD2-like protein with hotdog domain
VSLKLSTVAIGDVIGQRSFEPTNVSLFLYNAAIWNPHRIHYDESYTTQVEKHPAVVVDGPLQGDWLSQIAINWMGDDGQLLSLEYSNRRATYLGEPSITHRHSGPVHQERTRRNHHAGHRGRAFASLTSAHGSIRTSQALDIA